MEIINSFSHFFEPLFASFGGSMPNILGALAIFVVGWFAAGIIRRVLYRVLNRVGLDRRINKTSTKTAFKAERTISKLAYYLVLTFVCIITLSKLGVSNVFEPLNAMLTAFFGFIPKIIAAGIIGFAGYIIATLASETVGLITGWIERTANKLNINENIDLVAIAKNIVFVFVFVPILILAIDALEMKAISEPATAMLATFIGAIPNIIAAGLIVGIFFVIGRFVTNALAELLKGFNLDNWAKNAGLAQYVGNKNSVVNTLKNVAFFFIMFTGIISGTEKLGLVQLTTTLNNIYALTGQILFGMVIMLAGVLISNFVSNNFLKGVSNTLAMIAKTAIIGVFMAISLNAMGIANSIVNLAFGLTLGAVAVAFALAFGLGGRDAAGKQVASLLSNLNTTKKVNLNGKAKKSKKALAQEN